MSAMQIRLAALPKCHSTVRMTKYRICLSAIIFLLLLLIVFRDNCKIFSISLIFWQEAIGVNYPINILGQLCETAEEVAEKWKKIAIPTG
ncbi:hypothetical protein [Candidatus Enterococcus ferrettii]|uniref:hypothetical protein n=1 Tax=Candidatus Enterococcus ferrettii TaxID=2815324 RepID=UPI001F608C63|nr:hypothetical protein [Enterococcus sp. 665A]